MPFDGSQLDDVTKLLIEGRERIEQGWCQNVMRERHGICMVGALYGASNDTYWAAVGRLAQVVGVDATLLPYWNDVPERTKDEVLAAYDEALSQIT